MNTTEKIHDYLAEYDSFMEMYKKAEISGEEVGELVMRMASYYARYNLRYVRAMKMYATVAKEIETSTDKLTGKPISSTKAKVIASATPESNYYEETKAHVSNLEQLINALKALQRGVLQEYSHASL
jgi:hypothetical protein